LYRTPSVQELCELGFKQLVKEVEPGKGEGDKYADGKIRVTAGFDDKGDKFMIDLPEEYDANREEQQAHRVSWAGSALLQTIVQCFE
jgi:hypothetical protein